MEYVFSLVVFVLGVAFDRFVLSKLLAKKAKVPEPPKKRPYVRKTQVAKKAKSVSGIAAVAGTATVTMTPGVGRASFNPNGAVSSSNES